MGTQGAGRKRLPNRERLTAEDDALNQIAREAEARLAAKRAARAEAREIRMKELERQQKEIYQVQKKYYGLDTKWGDIEQWMEDSERYSRRARRNASASDEDERMSVGSRGSLRAGLENERTKRKSYSKATNGYEEDAYGSSQSRKSSRASYYSDLGLHSSAYASTSQPSSQNGNWPSLLYSDALPARSYRASVYDESVYSGSRRCSASSSRAPSEYSCYLGSGSRASSRASSARASPVIEERPEKDFEKGARTVSSLSAATLASLGGTSSRRGSGDTSISADTEASIREIKDSLAEVEEKYKKAMVSNAQLDNEKTNFMYQVDTLKDALLELEEQLAESRRQYEEKSKEFEREKHAHSILQFQFMEMKEALKQREEMLAKHGIIPDSEVATNGETSDILVNEGHLDSSKTVQGTTQALKTTGDGTLGKANEVDMKNEILEDVGKREILQNTEQEEHKEESEEQEIKTLHADENAKAEKIIEENDAMSTMTLTNSRLTEQIQSHPEHVSGNVFSNDDSDADALRKERESTGSSMEAQQPVSKEAEQSNLNQRTNQNSEVGSLQDQVFKTPQEMPSDLDTECELEKAAECELEKAAAEQREGEDFKASNAVGGNEKDQEAAMRSSSCELVSHQSGLPEVAVAGSFIKEPSVASHTERPQHSGESTEEKVMNVLERELVGGKECTDGRTDETESGRTEEENEMGSAVQGQTKKTDSVGMEGKESRGNGAPADASEKEDGDQTQIQLISSEDGHIVSLEEQKMQDKTEHEKALTEKDGPKEVLTEKLEACSDSAETGEQEKASGEAVDCITVGKGSVLQQAEPDEDVVKEAVSQESSLDPSLSDCNVLESEVEIQDESGKRKESRAEGVEDLKPNVEIQSVQCSEEVTCDTVGEKNISLEGEAQNAVKQEEGESRQESTEDLKATTEKKVDEEALKETEKQLELTDHHCGGFASEEEADNSLQGATKLLQHFLDGNTEAKEQNPELGNVCERTEKKKDKNEKVQGMEEDKNQVIDEQGEAKEALSEEKVDSLAQTAELDENVSEQVKLEGQAEDGVENYGDAFDFDEKSKQILETEECGGEKADTQEGEGAGAHGVTEEVAQTGEIVEGRGNVDTEDTLTGDDSLQHKNEGETEETGHAQGKASSQKTDEEADVLEDKREASDSNDLEKMTDENVLEQDLEGAGNNREESKEDLQSGRRGKGKSKDDCTIS
ncbi:leucine-rich repeat flightless-interacting protein 1 isoform X3 [Struthio camelus]|uniref:leucine-rich repeat flightless-interacting protein 1 isoform X3 n=1 Tax=Struthio camelus TaxID=8801 RepID=UPI0036040D3C